MTDTTPTPNELLTRIAEASRAGRVEELRSIVNELPVPPKPSPRLLIVDAEGMPLDGGGVYWSAWAAEALAGPDPMTVIEQAVELWGHDPGLGDADADRADLVARIRTALEGATQ
jgi:hypothetical protein